MKITASAGAARRNLRMRMIVTTSPTCDIFWLTSRGRREATGPLLDRQVFSPSACHKATGGRRNPGYLRKRCQRAIKRNDEPLDVTGSGRKDVQIAIVVADGGIERSASRAGVCRLAVGCQQ